MARKAEQFKQRHYCRLQSLTRGRLRVKVDPKSRASHLMKNLQRKLHLREGIQDVSINPTTGSVNVNNDHARYSYMKLHPDPSDAESISV